MKNEEVPVALTEQEAIANKLLGVAMLVTSIFLFYKAYMIYTSK